MMRLLRTRLGGGRDAVCSPLLLAPRARPGLTLIECAVALATAGLVLAAVVSVMATQADVLRAAGERSADAAALRVTAGVLRDELRWIDPLRDVRSIAGDSVAVRLFRGGGAVCGAEAGSLLVEYAGMRLPDPAKDSVLVLVSGAEAAYALSAAAAATCAARPAQRVAISAALPPVPVFVLIFESGTYYVRDRAFRYRLGREGRQPLTEERFATGGTVATVGADSAAVRIGLAWPRASRRSTDTLHMPFANGPR